MKTVTPPIPFAGSQLGPVRHVCAFDSAKKDIASCSLSSGMDFKSR